MKKVYVLMGSRGSWDSYEKFIIGVFDTYEMAKAEMQNTISELENKPRDYTSKSINIKDIQIAEYPINHKILSLVNYEKTN